MISKFKLILSKNTFKIFIDNIIHLSIKQSNIVGIQSWKAGKESYCIEFYLKDNIHILTEYNNREKWIAILNLINKEDIFKDE